MNKLELSSVSLLKDLVENHGVLGVKTSFEDEGASLMEVIRLKELCNQAGTKILLKIAGKWRYQLLHQPLAELFKNK